MMLVLFFLHKNKTKKKSFSHDYSLKTNQKRDPIINNYNAWGGVGWGEGGCNNNIIISHPLPTLYLINYTYIISQKYNNPTVKELINVNMPS